MDTAAKGCRGLVLAGGGARGSYQVGVWRALDELGWTAGAVTGTSVGCLNGAMYVLGQYETARDMWLTIRSEDVLDLPDPAAGPRALGEAVRQIVAEGGLDISPLEGIVARVLDEDALRASPIKFGLVTVEKRGLRPHELTLDEIPRGQLADYLLASAAFYPAMPARSIDGVEYLDGGYSNNMPTGLAARLGAEELVCVDLEGLGFTKPNRTGLPTTTIRSHWELGEILKFDPAMARRNIELGYYDTLRAFGRLRGDAYPVALPGSALMPATCEDLYDVSGGRDLYKNLYISEINTSEDAFIRLSNGEEIMLGNAVGEVNKDFYQRVQIRKTIEEHLEKEKRLRPKGIKVLSLFFIDRVANYRSYDESGNPIKGKFAKMFEEEYLKAAARRRT